MASPVSPVPPTPEDFARAREALARVVRATSFAGLMRAGDAVEVVEAALDAAESALRLPKPTEVERVWAALKKICDPAGGRGDYLEVCDDQLAAALGAPSSPTPPEPSERDIEARRMCEGCEDGWDMVMLDGVLCHETDTGRMKPCAAAYLFPELQVGERETP